MRFLESFWWLRIGAIRFHLKMFLGIRIAPLRMMLMVSKRKLSYDEAFRLTVKELLALATEMELRSVPSRMAAMRPYRMWLRWVHYSTIVLFVTKMPEEMRGNLPQDDIKQIVHYGELALREYNDGAKDYVEWKAVRSNKMPPLVRQRMAVAAVNRLLGSAFVELHPNDAAYDLATAFRYFTEAAETLEGANHLAAQWEAAEIWCELGEAYLAHPFEADSTQKAQESLQRAKRMVAPHLDNLKPPPAIMKHYEGWQKMPTLTKLRHTRPYTTELLRGRKQVRSGNVDPSYAWLQLAPLMLKINRQLGIVFRKRGDLAGAIEYFTAALTSFKDDPDVNASINTEIGYAYLECGALNNKDNIKQAIRHFDGVLDLQGKIRMIRPFIRALIGGAYAIVALGEIAVDAERTKMMPRFDSMARNLHVAMRLAREKSMTDLCQEAAYVLGLVHMNKREYARAYKAFALSSRLLDRLQRSSRTLRLKRYRIGTNASLYNNLLYVAMRYKRTRKPDVILSDLAAERVAFRSIFTFSERGRAVFLQEEMVNRNILPRGADAEDLKDFLALRRSWHHTEINLNTKERNLADESEIAALTRKRDKLEDDYFTALRAIREAYDDPLYDPDMPVAPAKFYEIRNAINKLARVETSVLVEYHVSFSRIHILILLPKHRSFSSYIYSKEIILDCEDVGETIRGWERPLEKRDSSSATNTDNYYWNWLHWGSGKLMQTLDRLSQLAEYPNKMIGEWEKRTGAKVNRVILAPHKFLHLVPLHAIQLPSGEIWGDTVAIQYVPSASVLCRLIQAMPSRIKADGQPVKQSVIAIAGQSDSHAFEREAKAVSRILGGVAISGGRKSVDEIVREIADADYIHFSCHGIYDRVSPMGGGLECAWGESRSSDQSTSANQPIRHGRLTLGEIFERVHLPRAPIVVLSACETGISKIEQSHDEYIGLPAGFLYAGAKTVVSSLWRVPDPAVQLLMKQMAQRLAEGKRISEALRVAQQWLRTLPWDAAMQEVATILQTDGSSTTSHDAESVLEMYPILRIADANPFENPFWWAGFTINGLG